MEKNLCFNRRKHEKCFFHKILLIMRLTTFLIFVTVGQLIAAQSYSQTTRLNFNLKGASVEEVINRIEEMTDFYFLYNRKIIDVERKVDISAENKKITEVLDLLFNKSNVKYTIIDRQIVLSDNNIVQQQRTVTGKITDSSGQALPGVTVVVKGTTTGIITDVDGNYTLSKLPADAILVFSFVGMKTQEISVAGKTAIDVVMEEDAIGIEEVVAIGYGTMKKSDLTGSMASVASDDLNQGVILSPQQMMQGKISGVSITMNNGQPGANSSVRIRGANSINFNNEPLYVIDGVPVSFAEDKYQGPERTSVLTNNPLNMLNPADIERIDVLKDASSTAIYGARAANGVILITTKKGKKGGKVDYETYFGVSQLRKKLSVLSAEQVRDYAASHSSLTFTDGGANVDWQDEIFRTAMSQSHVVSFSNGNENTSFRASLGYMDQDGIIISSGIENINASVNVNSKFIDDKLNISFNTIYANESSDNIPSVTGIAGDGGGDVIRDALRANPTIPVKDPNSLYSGGYSFIHQFVQNPVEEAELIEDNTESSRIIGNITAGLQLTKDLLFTTNLGYTKENILKKGYFPLSSRLGSESNGIASSQTRDNYSKLLETTLDYTKKFGTGHNLKFLAGYSYQKFVNSGSYIRRSNFVEDVSGADGIGAGENIDNATTNKEDNTIISFFGRLNYSFNDKYLLTATLRNDGSSRFGADSKWGLFPSVAGAWKISEEDFLKSSEIISSLKLRLGYGETGNQAVPNYGSLALVKTSVNLNPEIGVIALPSTAANPDLKWETTTQSNIGFDYSLFNGRISGSFDLYKKKTSDLILAFEIPAPTAITSRLENVGDVENKGIEFDIAGKLINKNDFKIEIYGNISANRNEVLSLSKGSLITSDLGIVSSNALSPQQYGSQILVSKVGKPINSLFGYEFIGFNENGEEQFRDQNNDDNINNSDRTIIGNTNPDFIYGLGANINWKNFDFNISLRGVKGVDVMNSLRNDLDNITLLPNINTLSSVLTEGATVAPSGQVSSRFVEDASFLRCENLTIGYNFRKMNIPLISNARLYVTGQNLFVLTDYSGYDPEVKIADYTTYPRPRIVLIGLKIQF